MEYDFFEMECTRADKWARKNGYRDYETYIEEQEEEEEEEEEEDRYDDLKSNWW